MEGMLKACVCLLLVCLVYSTQAEDILKLSIKPAPGMTRADLFYLKTSEKPRAVLILCPGCNGEGKAYLSDSNWRDYAKRLNLGLVGLSFASEMADLKNGGNGYYYVKNGSGKLLLEGLDRIYGSELPIVIYGISGGAHFTARFVEWKPERVVSWCAYSAAWWDKPSKLTTMPPGIVACGMEDERIDASQGYFWDGREVGKPWLWIDLKGTGHAGSRELDSFVREYFERILGTNGKTSPYKEGLWVDIYERTPASFEEAKNRPCAVAWLPDAKLFDKWISLTKGAQHE